MPRKKKTQQSIFNTLKKIKLSTYVISLLILCVVYFAYRYRHGIHYYFSVVEKSLKGEKLVDDKVTKFEKVKRGKVVDCETFNRGRYGTFVGFYVVIESDYETKKVLTKHCHSKADGYLGCQVEVGFDASTGEWIILE